MAIVRPSEQRCSGPEAAPPRAFSVNMRTRWDSDRPAAKKQTSVLSAGSDFER